MKQFTIKFTEENLNKHLTYDPNMITTLRDELKGDIGDVTVVDNEIYMLISYYELLFAKLIASDYDVLWKLEGFASKDDYLNEINRIYGICGYEKSDKKAYIHTLLKIEYRNAPKQIRNPATGAMYTIRSCSSKIQNKEGLTDESN